MIHLKRGSYNTLKDAGYSQLCGITAAGIIIIIIIIIMLLFRNIQCVSKKIPDIFSCNFGKHCRIFIMFGTHVTEKVSNQ